MSATFQKISKKTWSNLMFKLEYNLKQCNKKLKCVNTLLTE